MELTTQEGIATPILRQEIERDIVALARFYSAGKDDAHVQKLLHELGNTPSEELGKLRQRIALAIQKRRKKVQSRMADLLAFADPAIDEKFDALRAANGRHP